MKEYTQDWLSHASMHDVVQYITECFSMQKTAERIEFEKQHEIDWKTSGVKSWRELLNLD